jgi:anion-transporting  ArsA/GET3 family ATPase
MIVCCGPGGVGKTTMAAAMAMEGARQGRRTCVVTIDPARRLADALGLSSLANSPGRVEGPWPGELWAEVVDTKSTFDALVIRYAADPGQAQGILENRLYRSLSESLSGTQEYMAMEKVHELHEEGRFDLVVVDTPPTRNALDFLSAPGRLTRLLDNRVFRMVVTPTSAYLRVAQVATQALLRAASRIVGSEMVKDTVAFFQAFEGMEAGVHRRAEQVQETLSQSSTAFVVVSSARRQAIEQASFFVDCLRASDIVVQALIVNRLQPRFDAPASPCWASAATTRTTRHDVRGDEGGEALAALVANLEEFRAVADREESQIAPLAAQVAPAPVARVPFFATDVHDLDGLAAVVSVLCRDLAFDVSLVREGR